MNYSGWIGLALIIWGLMFLGGGKTKTRKLVGGVLLCSGLLFYVILFLYTVFQGGELVEQSAIVSAFMAFWLGVASMVTRRHIIEMWQDIRRDWRKANAHPQ